MTHKCRVCEVELNDDNWYLSYQKKRDYICRECSKEKSRLYREENPDKIKESQHLYIEKNRDEINARQRLYQVNNPEKIKERNTKNRRKNGGRSMSENKECPVYLGVHIGEHNIGERVLSCLFKTVEQMPYGNHGYDFFCNNNIKIDSKISCFHKNGSWLFGIDHNTTADYFLLVALDNREDLNLLRVWLIPGEKMNHLTKASISPRTFDKWNEYEQKIDKISVVEEMQ